MATFTALNGGEPKPSDNPSGSPTAIRSVSEERPSVSASGQEQKTPAEATSKQREHWSDSRPDRSSYQSSSYPDVDGAPKRKRSSSAEPRREGPESPEERTSGHQPHSESRDAYGTTHRERERDYRPYGDEGREHGEGWYQQHSRDDRNAYDAQNSAGSIPSQTDEQIGDSLRRAGDSQHNYSPTSPDGDDSPYYGGSFTPEQRRDGAVQSDPKRRKRNFSNRTKTGCLTCRKRKKKCDETKPECEFPREYLLDLP
jgi:hypothetical protein